MEREAWQAVADVLDAAIEAVASRPEECARSPGRDFARNRKLGLGDLLRLIVTMGSDTLGMELLRAWGMDADAPTVGALCQQWAKPDDEAMPMLHAEFLSAFEPVATGGRYWLLACDGTGRRTKVVGVFPSTESLMRLVGSVLVDVNEEWMLRQFMDASSLVGLERDTNEPEPPSAEVVELARTRIAAAIEERRAA